MLLSDMSKKPTIKNVIELQKVVAQKQVGMCF